MFFCHRCEQHFDDQKDFILWLFIVQPQYNAITCVCPRCNRMCAAFVDSAECMDAYKKGARVVPREVPNDQIRYFYDKREREAEERQQFINDWESRFK